MSNATDNPKIEVLKAGGSGVFTNYIYKAIPLAFDESMSYYETLAGLRDYLEETVIPTVNNNAEAVAELQGLYEELNKYVDDYFKNLDVQEEINNKLDDLVADGTLTRLIGEYVQPLIDEQNQEISSFKVQVNGQIALQNTKIQAVESGSPLVASSVSGMTDTTRVYVNTTDGHWYWYDGNAWQDGGVYQATTLNFLYDTLLLEDGFVNNIGLITANANFKHTKYLPINIISSFQIKGTQGSLVYAYYDKDLKYLGGLVGKNSSDPIISFENIPENAMYVRFTKDLNKTFNINFNEYIQKFLELYIENYPKIKMSAGYINQTGEIASGGVQFEYSENYIPISMIESVNLPYISGASILAFYDKELNYISSIYGPSGSGTLTSLNDIVIPSNAIYVRYTRSIKYGDSISFGNIKLKNIYYLPEVLKDISTKIINQLETYFDIKNVLYGKKIVAIGDSMTRGHSVAIENGWLAKIAQRNNMTYVNLGINGTFLSNHVWNNYQPVVNRINEIPEDSDYVIVFAGTNDITSSSIQVGEENSTDTTTIYGALNSICQQLLTRFPNKKVCFITPYIRNQYKEKCLQVEEAFKNALRNNGGIPYFDNFQSGGIDFSNETQASSLTLNDGLHLNVDGMNWVSYKYENFIKGL